MFFWANYNDRTAEFPQMAVIVRESLPQNARSIPGLGSHLPS